ncbi:5-formyltetrahydrofolate cyclo-ligase [Catenuloplanes atrovinosus]|uniref:5-formyltetrahydrofolate cyclo-ligase n=1 Tax=Catenuloplanes atrovinosus TaxID=137266 RepID=A0AAE4CDH3_9ACTN|nr:5-formyltetrahydrofolate cyclo-ligase [Catenuloplanes atrovinosus]MDR7280616.1 5-formyltetrahydrofolate cyclo-ligase [Catenuloplanes atrovinosus]
MPDFSDQDDLARENDHRALKTTVRDRVLAARRALPEDDRRAAAGRVRRALSDLIEAERPALATAYVPVGAEPGGADLPDSLSRMLRPHGTLLLPILLRDLDLDWAEYGGPASLTVGARGLREPSGRRRGPAAIAEATLVVVPALAVDRRGVRLGRGGGSYDRALTRCASALVVALLHDGELVDELPSEPHDRRVQAVITPSGGLVRLG